MRNAARWMLALFATAAMAVALAGQSGGKVSVPAAQKAKESTAFVARVKPPKPFSQMTLVEVGQFQERALQTYLSRWRWWQTHRSARMLDSHPQLRTCRGARAPAWACWGLEASIWTKRELGETRAKLAKLADRRLRAMGMYDWETAARYVQKVFPGTYEWLMSCSGGEGGHGAWVRYGGDPYYAGYELTDAVGGNLQFRPSTFYGYVDDAWAWAKAHGLSLPPMSVRWDRSHIGADAVAAWLSPLAQAVTGAYMRGVVGNSHTHWAPSIDAACY